MSGSVFLDENEWNSKGMGASEWKLINMKLTDARYSCVSVSFNNFIYTIGGNSGHNELSSVERFDSVSNNRSILPSTNCKRDECAAVIVEKKLYAIGGLEGNQCLDSLEMLDLTEESGWVTLSSSMKNKRAGFAAVAFNHLIYVVGGRNGTNSLSSVEMFDTKTLKWTELSPMRTALKFPSAVVANDCIFVMGGKYNNNSILSSMESYNTKTKKWTTSLPPMITQRWGGCCVSLSDDSFIVMGGLSSSEWSECTSKVEAYHVLHKKWTPLPDMTKKRGFLSGVMIDGSVYALGGGNENGNILETIEKMEIKGLKMTPPPPPPSFPDPPIELESKKRIEALQVYATQLKKINEEYFDEYDKKKGQFHEIMQKKIDHYQSIIQKHEKHRNDVEDEFEKVLSSWKNDFTRKLKEVESQIDLLKCGEHKKRSSVPNQLLCPMTLEIMRDPVIASDGFTYEREAIEKVLNSSDNPKSPMTNKPFANRNLIQNNVVRSLCGEYSSK